MSKMQEDVLIRDFKKSDLEDLLEVMKESFAEEFEISGFDSDHIRKMVDRMFSLPAKIILGFLKLFGKEPFRFFVAEFDGRVVGSTMENTKRKMGYIANVMVHPAYRRKGIATKLMKKALNHIKKKKSSKAILHVVSKNTPAKGLYHKLGFKKFENAVYLTAPIDSWQKPQDIEDILIRDLRRKDTNDVYNLIKRSEDTKHLKLFDFRKEDLRTPLIERLARSSTDKKMVAMKNDRIVGYAHASYTTSKEAGRIRNIQVYPEMRSEGIEESLISAGVDHIKKVGTNKVVATTLSTRQKLIEKMKQLGFEIRLKMEAMVLEL